jgi:hypothetical protein
MHIFNRYILTFSKRRGSYFLTQKLLEELTEQMMYLFSFLENDEVQQPVILPNMNENQNPWHMHIFNIHTNIKQNKRFLTQKLWEELAGKMTYPICIIIIM